MDEEGLLEAIAKLTVMYKEEGGDGGDSDKDGEEIEFHREDMFKRKKNRYTKNKHKSMNRIP